MKFVVYGNNKTNQQLSNLPVTSLVLHVIAHFTVNISRLHYNVFECACEAILGRKCKIARNCLTSTFKNSVMQIGFNSYRSESLWANTY